MQSGGVGGGNITNESSSRPDPPEDEEGGKSYDEIAGVDPPEEYSNDSDCNEGILLGDCNSSALLFSTTDRSHSTSSSAAVRERLISHALESESQDNDDDDNLDYANNGGSNDGGNDDTNGSDDDDVDDEHEYHGHGGNRYELATLSTMATETFRKLRDNRRRSSSV